MKYILTGDQVLSGKNSVEFCQKKSSIILIYILQKLKIILEKYQYLINKNLNSHTLKTDDNVTLIHLAAVHFDFQKNYYETNIDGTKNVIDYIEK